MVAQTATHWVFLLSLLFSTSIPITMDLIGIFFGGSGSHNLAPSLQAI
jgi:hypothetical protein